MKSIYKNSLWIIIIAIAATFLFTKQDLIDFKTQLAKVSVEYDQFAVVEPGRPIKVVKAVDGDTVQLANGEYLRYIGIDTPEEFDPRKPVQCFAHEAAEYNRNLVEGKEITFYHDVSVKDRYGRWLGFVYLPDGTFVNEKLVAEGYAFSYEYKPDISKSEELDLAQDMAQKSNLGLWAHCQVTVLKGGREQTNDLE